MFRRSFVFTVALLCAITSLLVAQPAAKKKPGVKANAAKTAKNLTTAATDTSDTAPTDTTDTTNSTDTTDTADSTDTTDSAGTTDSSGDTSGTAETPEPKIDLTLDAPVTPFQIKGNYPDGIKITATEEKRPKAGLSLHLQVKQPSDALLYTTDQAPADTAEIPTNEDGLATASLITNENSSVILQVTPYDGERPLIGSVQIFTLTGKPSFATSLGSKRSYLQIFLGETFTNNYTVVDDHDPATEDLPKNVGFVNGGQLIRLTFDTMWSRQKLPISARTPDRRTVTTRRADTVTMTATPEGRLTVAQTNERSTSFTPAADERLHSLKHGLWHTDANLEFSKFPFGEKATETRNENQKGLRDAFTGSLGLTWQPNRFASYDKRGDEEKKDTDDADYDAYRFGFFGKAGLTTRFEKEPGGNNSINRIQFGVRFTHSRSRQPSPVLEDRNEVPLRFVEASFARFSEWDGNDGASRLVIDAGLRITALSNDVFPIYAGAHLNAGPGQDDLRVFLGMLVRLDVLGKLVQGVTGGD